MKYIQKIACFGTPFFGVVENRCFLSLLHHHHNAPQPRIHGKANSRHEVSIHGAANS